MRPKGKEKFKASVMFLLPMCTYTSTHTYMYTHICDIYTFKLLNFLCTHQEKLNTKCILFMPLSI